MPELPEVETIVTDLRKKILGKKFLRISYCDNKKSLKSLSPKEFEKKIKNQEIIDIKRKGKNIFIFLSGGEMLYAHMKMTGHLLVVNSNIEIRNSKWAGEGLPKELKEKVNQFVHVVFELSGGIVLAFSDMRKFGYLQLVDKAFVTGLDASLGPEPLDTRKFDLKRFAGILKGSTGPIKKVLLDQTKIAGIGNIYGNEILFLAGVRPDRQVKKSINQKNKKAIALNLDAEEIKKIYQNIGLVLKKAIRQRGASMGDFRDTAGKKGYYQEGCLVYGRERKECKKCGSIIKRIKVGGRSAHFCPSCQR